jgi:hypothetical protein
MRHLIVLLALVLGSWALQNPTRFLPFAGGEIYECALSSRFSPLLDEISHPLFPLQHAL